MEPQMNDRQQTIVNEMTGELKGLGIDASYLTYFEDGVWTIAAMVNEKDADPVLVAFGEAGIENAEMGLCELGFAKVYGIIK